MKQIGNRENTTVSAICLLLTCFHIDRQLFTTAFKDVANLHFHMVPDFAMKQTVVIVYFILAAMNITYYNPMIVSVVQYLHEFSLLFLEHQFLVQVQYLKARVGREIDFVTFFHICQ